MKAHLFIAPALSLLGAGYWLNQQETIVTTLEERTRVIEERLLQVKNIAQSSNPSDPKSAATAEKRDEFTLADGSLDWTAIASLITKSGNGDGIPTDMKTMLKLQRKFMLMTEEEIEDGMSKIAALDLDSSIKDQLRSSLLQMMSQKNPEKALDLTGDAITEDGNALRWIQQNAFSTLAQKDPAAALAWLDKQIKDGKFVSKALDPSQNPRLRFESAIIGQLAGSDLAAAKARIATFSDAEKQVLFSEPHQWQRNGKMPPEFLTLARENLDPSQAPATIASAWSNIHNSDFNPVTEALNTIAFSDEERSAIVTQSVQNFIRSNKDENNYLTAYEWAKEQSPDQAATTISQALAHPNGRKLSGAALEQNFQTALNISETANDPAITSEFVRQYVNQNESALDDPLKQFQDPALAEKMREIYNALPKENE